MDTCICMAESLPYLLETITTLLIGYISIQNKKLKKIFFKAPITAHLSFIVIFMQSNQMTSHIAPYAFLFLN